MRNLNIQTLFRIGGFIPVLILLIISTLLFVVNFLKYQETSTLKENLELTKNLDNVVAHIGRERAKSGIYFASKGQFPNSKQELAKKRVATDKAIKKLKDVLQKYPNLNTPKLQQIMMYLNKINTIRMKINHFKIPFKDWFIEYYTKMDGIIYNYEAQVFQIDSSEYGSLMSATTPTIEKLLLAKQNLRKAIENWGRQRGFLSYVTTKNTPIQDEYYNLVFFKWFFTNNSLPISILSDYDPTIKNILNSPIYTNTSAEVTISRDEFSLLLRYSSMSILINSLYIFLSCAISNIFCDKSIPTIYRAILFNCSPNNPVPQPKSKILYRLLKSILYFKLFAKISGVLYFKSDKSFFSKSDAKLSNSQATYSFDDFSKSSPFKTCKLYF